MNTIYAVIANGGKQYRVTEGQTLDLELAHLPEGDTMELGQVLLVEDDSKVTVGRPFITNAKVVAEVLGEVKGEKLIIFKYKPKVRYRKKTGHRQHYTRVQIKSIEM